MKSCSQGGVRGGAATLFYPMWHLEVESLLVLKNNRGVEGNRVRHMDYGVQINKLMYTRLLKGEDITLFSPSDVPGLHDAFFADQEEFERLYTKYEKDDSIRKQRVKAVELFSLMMQERASTGRIYIQNVDHCNTHSPFDPAIAPVRQSNLCLEIALPTKPLNDVNDENGEIALCTLSAFNLGAINSLDELEELAILAVRALDALLDYQDYPIPAAKRGAMGRRTLGIGVINFADHLAKHGKRYSDGSANNLTHKTFEAIQYYLLKASNELAKEQGACPWFNETTYAKGILPIDTYKKIRIPSLMSRCITTGKLCVSQIKTHGLRNSTLSALMPSETSSQISNATNGIEPPRGYVSIKASKTVFCARWCRLRASARRLSSCCGKCRVTMATCNWWVSCRNLSISQISANTTTIRHASVRKSADAAVAERPAHRLQIRGFKRCIIRTPVTALKTRRTILCRQSGRWLRKRRM